MTAILLVIHVIIAVALIGIVLIQRSDQDGFGLGSGSGSNFMTGRQSANLLTRGTAILATLFVANSLLLSILAANNNDVSLSERIKAASEQPFDKPAPVKALDDVIPGSEEILPDAPAADAAVTSGQSVDVPVAPQGE